MSFLTQIFASHLFSKIISQVEQVACTEIEQQFYLSKIVPPFYIIYLQLTYCKDSCKWFMKYDFEIYTAFNLTDPIGILSRGSYIEM